MTAFNPFSSRFINPAEQTALFLAGESLEDIGVRLMRQHWRGEILGPHGTGKSTLFYALLRWLAEQGRQVRVLSFHAESRCLPAEWNTGELPDLYAIDGAEQLTWLNWSRVRWHCRRKQCGLLVTAHRSVGLPLLDHTRPADAARVLAVVHELTGAADFCPLDLACQLVTQHHGNLRLILFDLYDRWEAQRNLSTFQASHAESALTSQPERRPPNPTPQDDDTQCDTRRSRSDSGAT